MRTGSHTRAALAAAGKPAATIGRVIHLRRAPDRSAASAEVVAHELVHVAHPSSRPRFFGDDRHGPEEAQAQRAGQLVRALVAPSLVAPSKTQGLPVGALGGAVRALANDKGPSASQVQRSATASPSPSPASLLERTAELFRRQQAPAGGGGTGGAGGAGRTTPGAGGTTPGAGGATAATTAGTTAAVTDPYLPRPGDPPVIRRSTWGEAQPDIRRASTQEVATTSGLSAATFDALVEALEQRVIDELERRGLRHDPGVF